MKKLLISLIVGAVFIGAGIGVTFMELAEFTTAEYLPYVKQEKAETFTFTDSEIFDNSERAKVDIYLGDYPIWAFERRCIHWKVCGSVDGKVWNPVFSYSVFKYICI